MKKDLERFIANKTREENYPNSLLVKKFNNFSDFIAQKGKKFSGFIKSAYNGILNYFERRKENISFQGQSRINYELYQKKINQKAILTPEALTSETEYFVNPFTKFLSTRKATTIQSHYGYPMVKGTSGNQYAEYESYTGYLKHENIDGKVRYTYTEATRKIDHENNDAASFMVVQQTGIGNHEFSRTSSEDESLPITDRIATEFYFGVLKNNFNTELSFYDTMLQMNSNPTACDAGAEMGGEE